MLLIGPLCISNEANVAAGAELWGKASTHQLCSLKVPSWFPQTLSPSSLSTFPIHHVDSPLVLPLLLLFLLSPEALGSQTAVLSWRFFVLL